MSTNTRGVVEILIVEDSPTQALFLQKILELNNFRITLARNGREALDKLREHKPTLVISDIQMPEMDGYELCHAVKSDGALRDVPVILLTSLSAPQDIVRGLESGADNFVVKPYEPQFLLSRIHYILANQELRKTAGAEMGITIFFAGEKYFITADRLQILNLLLSTYETAVQRNVALDEAKNELESKAQELSRSNEDLAQFAYVVSHDLQEPLRMITSYLGLLSRRYEEKLDADAHEFIGFAVDGAKRMQILIRDLLTYSRVGTHAKAFAAIDASVVVKTAVANLAVAISESSADITYNALPAIQGDQTQLIQLFQNLIGNAIKFRGDKKPVVHIAAQQCGEAWKFSVSDNGIGIDPQFFDQIFVVFQRLHGRDEYPGTGIGLSVCKKIVERHGGRIWTESQPGQGTTFLFTLPPACSAIASEATLQAE